jgi:sugar/nucleoside kinase (ribokinase family)
MNNLLTVGSVAFDAIETPYGKTDKILGGAGTYISLAASYFGISSNIISVVGNDFPQDYFELLQNHNINTDGIEVKNEGKTFFWSGKYHQNMNNRDTITTELNVLAEFDPKVPDFYQNADILMLGNLTPIIQRQVIERLHKRPKLIAMDTMNFWMNIMLDELLKTISMVDVLMINDEEARQLSGENSLIRASRKIIELGPKYLIIKKGEHGALLMDRKNIFSAPAYPVIEVFDPTGAGDTFAGGFCGYLANTDDFSFENMKNAVIAGSAMASFCVEKFGTERIQMLKHTEIRERIDKFNNLTQYSFPANIKV